MNYDTTPANCLFAGHEWGNLIDADGSPMCSRCGFKEPMPFDDRDWYEDNSGICTARTCLGCGELIDEGAVCDECRYCETGADQ